MSPTESPVDGEEGGGDVHLAGAAVPATADHVVAGPAGVAAERGHLNLLRQPGHADLLVSLSYVLQRARPARAAPPRSCRCACPADGWLARDGEPGPAATLPAAAQPRARG